MWKDFKAFAFRGNLVDLAVAVIIAGAIGKVIASLVADIIMPIVGALLGGKDLTTLMVVVGDAKITYGNFLQTIIDFIIIAFVIFLMVRYAMKAGLLAKKEEPAPAGPTEAELLAEIRDLLKEKQ